MPSPATAAIVDSAGHPVALGGEIGRGGEGAVYALADRPEVVAKLYHRPPGGEKAAKLAAMAALRTERLLRLTAWPLETLHRAVGGPVAGLLMPRIDGHRAIHTLYSPKSRLTAFPAAGYPFLVHAAANVARAFAAIHEHGHVIGDVNHGNLVVSDRATVKLIDCDSFQIAAGDRLFRCEVGVATHTPPELQGRSFREITRTPNHDAFGLAVVAFQLLFMGRHPFSGAYTGPGEMPLERSISEFRFAYSRHATDLQMKAPPATPALATVSPEVAALFERAFAADGAAGGRPAAAEWAAALAALGRSLARCERSRAHQYWRGLRECPWCRIEARAGFLLFGLATGDEARAPSTFNLTAAWAAIAAVEPPEDEPLPALGRPGPAEPVRAIARRRRTWRSLMTFLGPAAVWVALRLPPDPEVFGLVGSGLALAASGIAYKVRGDQAREQLDAAVREAQGRYDRALRRWESEAIVARFAREVRQLDRRRDRHQNLRAIRQGQLDTLGDRVREAQLRRFLDTFAIAQGDVPGIGLARVATLQSYGIETAADVTLAAIRAIPGFGKVYTERLIGWRDRLEASFRFDATRGIERADLDAIDRAMDAERIELERALRAGPDQLRQVKAQIAAARAALRPELEEAARQLAQARADREAL